MRVRGKPHTSGKMVNRSNLIVLKGKGDCTLTQGPSVAHTVPVSAFQCDSMSTCQRVFKRDSISVFVRFNVNMSASQPVSVSAHLHIGKSAC